MATALNPKHEGYICKYIKIPENRKHAKDFIIFNMASGIGEKRLIKYCDVLKIMDAVLSKDLRIASKEDLINLMAHINNGKSSKGEPYSVWSKYTYVRVITKFYKWLLPENEYRDKAGWIKAKRNNASIVMPESLISESEFEKMLSVTKHARDRCILMVLYEMGLRSDELRSCRIKNLQMDGTIARLKVEGKTGSRRVLLIKSFPFIKAWLTAHPDSENMEAFLFPALSTRNHLGKMRSGSLNDIMKTSAKEAGIKKRIFPHLMRHSSATNMSKDLSEMELRELYGWSKSSTITSTYLHISQHRLEARLMQVNGMAKAVKEEPRMLPVECVRCGTINSFDAKHCNRCHMPFNARDALDNQAKWDKIGDVMSILTNLPQFQEALSIAVEKMKKSN